MEAQPAVRFLHVHAVQADHGRIESKGRRAGSALRIHEAMKARPITSLAAAGRLAGIPFPAAASAMTRLVDLGIVNELTGKRSNRVFAYGGYLATLSEGVE